MWPKRSIWHPASVAIDDRWKSTANGTLVFLQLGDTLTYPTTTSVPKEVSSTIQTLVSSQLLNTMGSSHLHFSTSAITSAKHVYVTSTM